MLLLATTTAGLGVDCVDHPDFLDSQKTRTWENKCDGEARFRASILFLSLYFVNLLDAYSFSLGTPSPAPTNDADAQTGWHLRILPEARDRLGLRNSNERYTIGFGTHL